MPFRTKDSKKTSKLSHYCRAGFITLLVSACIVIPFLCIFSPIFLSASLLFNSFIALDQIGHLLASSSYVGKTIDLWNEEDVKKIQKQKWELRWTIAGLIVGVGLGVFVCCTTLTLSAATPVLAFLSFLNVGTLFMRQIGAVTGFCNRLGGLFERSSPIEQIALLAALVLGLVCGIALIASGFAPLVQLAHVITIFIPGCSPFVASSIFLLRLMSTFTSCADYISRALTFHFDHDKCRKRHYEYKGAWIGSLLGALLGVLILATGVTVMPLATPAWMVFGVIAPLTMIICVSDLGGLGARLGRQYHEWFIAPPITGRDELLAANQATYSNVIPTLLDPAVQPQLTAQLGRALAITITNEDGIKLESESVSRSRKCFN